MYRATLFPLVLAVIVAEPAGARQFLPKHYLDPIPLQQIQLSNGTLSQNPGW